MLHASLVQQYSRACLDASEMDYYVTVRNLVGNITKTNLPELKAHFQEFQEIYESIYKSYPSLTFRDDYRPTPDEVREMLLRYEAYHSFEGIITEDSELQDIDLANLKDLLFRRLYPTNVV